MTEGLVKCPVCYRQFWIRGVTRGEPSRAVPPHGMPKCGGSGQTAPVVDHRSR